MKTYTFYTKHFANPEDAIKIATRMGWAPEQNDDGFTITFPEEDYPLVEFIFEYFM